MGISIKKKKELLDLKFKELRREKDRLRELVSMRREKDPQVALDQADGELHRVISLVKQMTTDIGVMKIDLYGDWAPKKKKGDNFDSREKQD